MDPRRFDILVKSLSTTGTRRGLVQLLATLPLGMAVIFFLSDEPDAAATDDDHGSSHRHHRRKAKHRHQTGNDKEHRKGKRKGQNQGKANDPGEDTGTGRITPPNPCQGKADRACCAGDTGKQWCQGGACVAIPTDARATLTACGGKCDGPSTNPTADVCGQELACPSCGSCNELCVALGHACDVDCSSQPTVSNPSEQPPRGAGDYCTNKPSALNDQCPCLPPRYCLGGLCRDVCGD